MKLVIVFLFNLSLTFSVFAKNYSGEEDLDATPTLESAKQEALDYAYKNIFSEILDHDSSVTIRLATENEAYYTFKINANDGWTICSAIIYVSKELGHAFQDDTKPPMACKSRQGKS